jgi:glutathione S-transferase
LAKLWPPTKFPVLQDEARGAVVAESTIIIEYLVQHYPSAHALIPSDPDEARETRFRDRFFDGYVMDPMQRIVADRLRATGTKDPTGVAQAKAALTLAYGMLESMLAGRTWAMGDAFGMADCAAAPALFYADWVLPLGTAYPVTAAYLRRLCERPSFAQVVREAEPFRAFFPQET